MPGRANKLKNWQGRNAIASPGGQYVDRKRDPALAVATPSIQSTNFMGKIVR